MTEYANRKVDEIADIWPEFNQTMDNLYEETTAERMAVADEE
jgi:hypothetical protein